MQLSLLRERFEQSKISEVAVWEVGPTTHRSTPDMETTDMASPACTISSTAITYRSVHRQPKLFTDEVVQDLEKEKKRLEGVVQKLEKERTKATEAAKTYKLETVSLTIRVKKLRNLKLQAEQAVERKEAARAELLNELRQRTQYSTSLEERLDRQQRYMDRCMMNLNKVGRVPTVRCIDCDTPTPLSDYQLRTSKIKGKSEHWLINPFCSKCRKERQTRYEAQRRDKAKLIASGGTPTEKQQQEQLSAMATAFVERLPDGAIDRVLENLEIAEEGMED